MSIEEIREKMKDINANIDVISVEYVNNKKKYRNKNKTYTLLISSFHFKSKKSPVTSLS